MKWLQENWTKVVLIALLLIIGAAWNNSRVKKKEYKAVIEQYETDISLRHDSINDLKHALLLEKETADSLINRIDELDSEAAEQEEVIKDKDREIEEERRKIKELTPDESVQLLSTNLSNEMGEEVKLKLKTVRNDTVVQLDIKHVVPLNIVFAERDLNIEKMNDMQSLLDIKEDKIDKQTLLILSHAKSIGLLEETIEQKDGIIDTKDEVINEMKKRSRKDKVKFFFIGFGTGLLTGLGISLI